MSLTGVAPRVSPSLLAREPRSLALVAWFDGWGQAQGMPGTGYPRELTPAEAATWREGHHEGHALVVEARERDHAAMAAGLPCGWHVCPAHPTEGAGA